MATQIITLIGVLVGALTSYLATTFTEHARHKRALETRWDERKLNVYADYASAVKIANIAAKRAFIARSEPELLTAALAQIDEAEASRST